MTDFIKDILLNKHKIITGKRLMSHNPLSIEVCGISDPLGSIFICFYIGKRKDGIKKSFNFVVSIHPSDIVDYKQSSVLIRRIILDSIDRIPENTYDLILFSRNFGIKQEDFVKPIIIQKKIHEIIYSSKMARKLATKAHNEEKKTIIEFYRKTHGIEVTNLSNQFNRYAVKVYGMNKYHKLASVLSYYKTAIYNRIKFDLMMSCVYLKKSKIIRSTRNWFLNNSEKLIEFYNKYLDNLEKKNIIVIHSKPRIYISEKFAKVKLSYKLGFNDSKINRYIIFNFGDKNEKRKRDKRQD